MKVLSIQGKEELAHVYVARMREEPERLVEFVESVQPPYAREEKWVLIVSTLFGCPIKCLMCDACTHYHGRLDAGEILAQIDFMVRRRFTGNRVPIPKFKVQFARMGEPALNDQVLEVLRVLPERYDAPGLMPCISTVGPAGKEPFFENLIDIKDRYFSGGRFQMQFSVHTTDSGKRDALVPVRKWDFQEIADFGENFWKEGDRKITLNFAMAEDYPVDPDMVRSYFPPGKFLIKLTPVNPTARAGRNGLRSAINAEVPSANGAILRAFREKGYDTLLSIGELEENRIGSNCGMYVSEATMQECCQEAPVSKAGVRECDTR